MRHRERLRVLMIVQRLRPHLAGAELQALGLARRLRAQGHEVEIVATRYVAGLPRRESIDGVPVYRLPVLRGALLKPSQLLAAAAWATARARAFDIVHAHCVSPASLGAVLGARMTGVPVILKPSLGAAGGEIDTLLRSPMAGVLVRILRQANRFAVLTPGIGRELLDLGIPAERLVDVDNGVDLARFRPAGPGERRALRERWRLPEGPVVLFAGQLVARKGIAQLLEAWRMLAPELCDPLLVVTGEGPGSGAVRAAAAEPGARVLALGPLDDVSEIMRACDVFVMPSQNESFGNAVIEAMACGVPVVTGRTGIAAKLDIDPGAGRLLERSDAGGIARALRDTLSARDRAALASRARALAERFDFGFVADRYVELYRSTIDEAAP